MTVLAVPIPNHRQVHDDCHSVAVLQDSLPNGVDFEATAEMSHLFPKPGDQGRVFRASTAFWLQQASQPVADLTIQYNYHSTHI